MNGTRTRVKTVSNQAPKTVKVKGGRGLDINRSGSSRDEIAWVSLAAVYIAGWIAHTVLVRVGAWWHWVLVVACIVAATALLVWRIWELMGPRRRVERENVTAAFAAAGIGATGTVLFAESVAWAIAYWVVGVSVVVVFNFQESRRVKGAGQDAHQAPGVDLSSVGIAPGTVLERDRTDPDKVHVHHADGQDTRDIRAAVPKLESMAKLKPGTLVASVGDHRGHTVIRKVDTTALDMPVVWPGPSRPGGSITEPLSVGMWPDRSLVESVWREHSMTMGTTGAGKTVHALAKVTEMLTRRDVVVLWCDPVKGVQSAGPVAGGVAWAAKDMQDAKAMVAGVLRAIPARTEALGKIGLTKWSSDAFDMIGMPLVYIQFEEAAWLVDHGALVKVAERARSAGVYFDMSLQRASFSRMDTDVRANLTRRTCFGVMDPADAQFCLQDYVLDGGADPSLWADRQPGKAYMSARDIPDSKVSSPWRGWMPSRDDGKTEDQTVLADVVAQHAAIRSGMDTVTSDALGPAYVAAVSSGHALAPARPAIVASVVVTPVTNAHGSDHDKGDSDADLDMTDVDTTGIDLDMTGLTDPADGDQTGDDDVTNLDPYADAQDDDDSADGVDLGDLGASKLSTTERNERFREMLAARWRAGKPLASQAELSREWHDIPGGGGRPWVYYRLDRMETVSAGRWVSRDEQDPQWWHINSDPATWPENATDVTDGDDGGAPE